MAVVRLILGAALLATALGLIFLFVVPGSGRVIDIGAVVFGVATWIVPLLLMALSGNKERTSLQSVGFTIYLVVMAMCMSAVGLSLALLTLIFAQQAYWAWFGLSAIAEFWVSGGIGIYVGQLRHRRARADSR